MPMTAMAGTINLNRPRSRPSGNLVSANSRFVISSSESLSLAVTNVDETAEVEGIVVTGTWFDTYPVPYPALPPVEGTRINAGKKTSFVKPARVSHLRR